MEIIGTFHTTLKKALQEIEPKYELLRGLIIAGTWPGENDEKLVDECRKKLRESKEAGIPILGICLGFQIIALEEGWKLKKLERRHVGIQEVAGWWGNTYETFWHDYGVVDNTGRELNSFRYQEKKIIGVQFHPEYQSSTFTPHPILKEFIDLCKTGNADGAQRSEP